MGGLQSMTQIGYSPRNTDMKTARLQMIAAKKLPEPVSADELPLPDLAPNLPESEASAQGEGLLTSNDTDEE